jgi:hypothetical protein
VPLLVELMLVSTEPKLVVGIGRFQAMGIPMAKILRLHLSAQCALREITILHNFAIEKVENIFHCKDLGIKKPSFKIVLKLFKKNSQLDVESELNHKQIGKCI